MRMHLVSYLYYCLRKCGFCGTWEQNGPLRDWRRAQLKRTDLKVRHYMGEEKKAGLKPGTYRDNVDSQNPTRKTGV
jgi:hypothetical protein